MKIEVYVFRRPNKFNVHENLYNMIGYADLKGIFTDADYKRTTDILHLYYPERFLNVLEQRDLLRRLEAFGYDHVEIITHSEHICTTVPNDCLKVVSDELIEEGSQFKLSNEYVGLPDDSGLGTVYGGVD